jgi:outer membrane immunogenic protein
MRRVVFSFLGATALTIASAQVATAADMPVKAPLKPVIAAYNWSGCYLGGYVGGGWQSNGGSLTDNGGGVFTSYNGTAGHSWDVGKGSSVIAGGTLGCNWQAPGNNWVWGLESELGYMRARSSAADPVSPALDTVGTVKNGNWYGVLAGRGGISFDRALWYLKGGVAFVRSAASVVDTCNTGACGAGLINATGNSTYATWALGTGLEYAFNNAWSLKGEYLYLGRGPSYTVSGVVTAGPGTGTTSNWSTNAPAVHTLKVGLNYFFRK